MKRTIIAIIIIVVLATKDAVAGHQLTDAQLDTLKIDSATPCAGLQDQACADLYNSPASPDFWAYRTNVCKEEYTGSTSIDGTVFNWTGAGFITRSVGERDAWRELFNQDGCVNPSLPQVRQAFLDIFSGGTSPAPANRTHLATVSREKATRLEKLYATGTGSTASPATRAYVGQIDAQTIGEARGRP